MSVLVLMICLSSRACDELSALAVWRREMTNIQCEEKLPALVEHIQENRLNPPNGYYKLTCRSALPKV